MSLEVRSACSGELVTRNQGCKQEGLLELLEAWCPCPGEKVVPRPGGWQWERGKCFSTLRPRSCIYLPSTYRPSGPSSLEYSTSFLTSQDPVNVLSAPAIPLKLSSGPSHLCLLETDELVSILLAERGCMGDHWPLLSRQILSSLSSWDVTLMWLSSPSVPLSQPSSHESLLNSYT